MCVYWRETWQAPTVQLGYLLTLSACPSRHCRLPGWPGARRGEPIGMAPRPRRTDPTDTRPITRGPMLPTLTRTEGWTAARNPPLPSAEAGFKELAFGYSERHRVRIRYASD